MFFFFLSPFRVTLSGSTFTLKELRSGTLRGAVTAAVSKGASLVSRGTREQEPQPLETDFLKNGAEAAPLSLARAFVLKLFKVIIDVGAVWARAKGTRRGYLGVFLPL